MATMPLAALAVQTPQQQDLLTRYEKLMALRSMQGQQQLTQAQLQEAQTANEQQQLNLQQDQAIQRAAMDSGGDLDKFMDLSRQYGGGMKAISNVLAMKTSLLQIDKDTLANNLAKSKQLTGMLQPIVDETDPAKKSTLWQDSMAEAVKEGLVGQDIADKFPTYPGDDKARLFLNQHKLVTDLADETLKHVQTQGEEAKTNSEQMGLIGQTLMSANSQQQLDAGFEFLAAKGMDKSLLALFPHDFSPQNMQVIQRLALTPAQQAQVPLEKMSLQDYMNNHPGMSLYEAAKQQKIDQAVAQAKQLQPLEIQKALATGTAAAQARGEDFAAMLKTGINPITKERLSLDNAPDTMLVNASGQVVPTNMIQLYKPTQQERQTADTARQVLAISSELRQAVQQHPDLIGPLMGRSAKGLEALGFAPRDAQTLLDDVGFLQSAATKMHTGRFSSEILQKMGKMIDAHMNQDQFEGGLDSIDRVAGRYAKEDQLITVADQKAMRQQALDDAQKFGPALKPGQVRVFDPTGGYHDFKSQADATAFMKAAGIPNAQTQVGGQQQ